VGAVSGPWGWPRLWEAKGWPESPLLLFRARKQDWKRFRNSNQSDLLANSVRKGRELLWELFANSGWR
jgi:hypothetical protein